MPGMGAGVVLVVGNRTAAGGIVPDIAQFFFLIVKLYTPLLVLS